MNVKDALAKLQALGDAKRKAYNAKVGPDGCTPCANQFGVPMGDIRKVAKQIKGDQKFLLELWKTGNMEAQLVTTLLLKPKELSAKDVDALTRSTSCAQVADWLNSYIVAQHPEKDSLREKWMNPKEKDRWAARAGWHLTASMVNKQSDGVDVEALLDRIEKQMPKAPPETQWAMNNTLLAIGIKHAKHRKRAIAIGEKIGLYKVWPMSKGCIIPYVPTAVPAMVKRLG